uniref:Uncharacterized protein n=1 Tax=Arundo donax TaxID=35708 RepID=A0A0A8Y2C0_ARUDO
MGRRLLGPCKKWLVAWVVLSLSAFSYN